MDIIVKSKKAIEEYAMQEHNKTSIVISIASKNSSKANIKSDYNNKIKEIQFIQFDDTDSMGGIEKLDASKIKRFLLKHIGDTSLDLIIVQCEAGQSRSAGVAAALMKYFWNDDTAIFNNHKYTPNMLCYRTMLNELMSN